MSDKHDKMAEAMEKWAYDFGDDAKLKLAADLRRIAEEEEKQPASEGDGAWSRFPNLSKAAAQNEPVYRTVEEVAERAWKELTLSAAQVAALEGLLSHYKPPCTCNVYAEVRDGVEAEREACAQVAEQRVLYYSSIGELATQAEMQQYIAAAIRERGARR